jgi:hypothetical protein
MKLLFCNITYMNHYIGNIEEDIPQGGGAWVKIHKDAHEKWNFLNVNGYCYGFVMNQSDQFHIERIDGVSRQESQTENVTVVWCALKPSGETVIVGWYENATVYRFYQSSIPTPVGLDRDYFVQAKADDCYLLPENLRTYSIGRAAIDGKGKGFGQSNFWYADSEYAKDNIVPEVAAYLQANRQYRINKCCADFAEPDDLDIPLSEEEDALATEYYDENEYMKFLPLGYRAYRHNPTGDNAYYMASALKALYQYGEAIAWFQKVIEVEGDSWETTSNLPYLLMECGRYEEAIAIATQLLTFREAKELAVKHEIYGILADNHFYLGRIDQAISCLDPIIAESDDQDLVEYTKNTRAGWLAQMNA